MIIIPDVHGRTFWKDSVKEKKDGELVVFLGDYLDHYRGEFDTRTGDQITVYTTLDNFKEIIEFKKQNPETTKLLLGNHDFEYILNTYGCRVDMGNFKEITDLFMDNLDLFEVAGYYSVDEDLLMTFSHTGILKGWVNYNPELANKNLPEVIEILNNLLKDKKEHQNLRNLLDQVGVSRWGDYVYGSPIWADVFDLLPYEWGNKVHQIFGHTQQYIYPIYGKGYSMLDCKLGFRLDEMTGDIEPCPGATYVKFNSNAFKTNIWK